MARKLLSRKEKGIVGLIWFIRMRDMILITFCHYMIVILENMKVPRENNTHSAKRTMSQGLINLSGFLNSDGSCIDQLRMDKFTFDVLCGLIRTHGHLNDSKNMFLEERVAIFLNILAHDLKQRTLVRRLNRSKETISRTFRQVLRVVLRLHTYLIKTPQPIGESSTDAKWKWFKDCLGALDGTHIKLKVPIHEKPKYRTRKGDIATNVLAACTKDMHFTYVLPGWEGSTADARVLKDALSRRHPFKVPRGRQDTISMNRNVIERCFRLLKMRWAILRNSSFYCADTHTDIINACSLLHNLIRQEMNVDPMEHLLDTEYGRQFIDNDNNHDDYINIVDTSDSWTKLRNTLATEMFDSWRLRRPFRHVVEYMMSGMGANKDKVSLRRWTEEEDIALVDLLLSLHVDGTWKGEGGFRAGYLFHLEKLMSEKMSESELKASNIESRLGYLKKRFNALLEIKHKGSGFGWDDGLKMVTGTRHLFNEWCKGHKEAKGLYGKPFPLFDAMDEIFSKDRATGVKGSTPLDRDDQDASKIVNENEIQDEEIYEVSTESSGTTKRSADESSKQPKKKKMCKDKEIHNLQKNLENLMGTMLENSNAQIAKLTAMMEVPKNLKVGLCEDLGKVHGISRPNILRLCMKMTEDDVAMFQDLTDEDEKFDFLAMVLEKD